MNIYKNKAIENVVKPFFDYMNPITYIAIMSRPLRIEFRDARYHVMNREANYVKGFYDKRDYTLFLNVLKEACNFFHVTVSTYCFMANNYHILVNTQRGNISRFMRHVNGVYTQRHVYGVS